MPPVRSLALLAVILGASACATADYRPPQRGMIVTWQWDVVTRAGKKTRETFQHRIVNVAGDEAIYRLAGESADPTNDRVHLYRGLFSYAYWRPGKGWAEHRFDRAALAGFWPLEVGKTVTFDATYGFGRGTEESAARARWAPYQEEKLTWTVLRRETVTVPAGTYRTVVIRRQRVLVRPETGAEVHQTRVSWYAPRIGWVVKQTVETRHRARPGAPLGKPRMATLTLRKVDLPK